MKVTKKLEELLAKASKKLDAAQDARSEVMDYLEEHYGIDTREEWTTVCLQYNGIPKNIYLVPSGQLYFVQGLLKLSHDDDTFEELLDSHNISYYKYNVYGVSDNKNSHGHFVCHADAFIL